MKVIAYHIDQKEKETLILANHKKHEITIVANSLTLDTLRFAKGKKAVIVINQDPLDAALIEALKATGVKYVVTSSINCNHIDARAAKAAGLEVAYIPTKQGAALEDIQRLIANLDSWAARP